MYNYNIYLVNNLIFYSMIIEEKKLPIASHEANCDNIVLNTIIVVETTPTPAFYQQN